MKIRLQIPRVHTKLPRKFKKYIKRIILNAVDNRWTSRDVHIKSVQRREYPQLCNNDYKGWKLSYSLG